MSFTVGDVYSDMQDYMSNRALNQTNALNWIQRTVWELTETYKFPTLQVSGPTVQLTQYSNGPYAYNTFLPPAQAGQRITNIDSFFIYYQTPVALGATNGANPGIELKFKTIDALETSLNIIGLTIYWTRHDDNFYFAFAPNQPYYVYARCRYEHPFSSPIALNDPILLPNSWRDIVGYAASERGAMSLNLTERAGMFHNNLYGDPKWQASGGTEGMPGLIFMRTSQEQRDQQTSTKQMRLMMRRAQK